MPKAGRKRASAGSERAAPYDTENTAPSTTTNGDKSKPQTKKGGAPRPALQETNASTNSAAPPAKNPQTDGSHLDVKLSAEETESVPIYDTPDQLRRKIHQFLAAPPPMPGAPIVKKTGQPKPYTQAALCRDMGGVNSNSLRVFLNRHGGTRGAESCAYYKGYVFFEKLRIFKGEKKTAQRTKNEKSHPKGFERKDEDSRPQWFWCHKDEDPNQVWADMMNERVRSGLHP
ncbi:MAG: hypothetical protein M4579_000411 [Chaenotheca gracillima]|nr:MAG: hypothetical protein M4579_000411 [Chaenotheca gracillima]